MYPFTQNDWAGVFELNSPHAFSTTSFSSA